MERVLIVIKYMNKELERASVAAWISMKMVEMAVCRVNEAKCSCLRLIQFNKKIFYEAPTLS